VSLSHVAVFAEGGPGIGVGHVARCAAISTALVEAGCQVDFTLKGPAGLAFLVPSDIRVSFVDWHETPDTLLRLARAHDACVFDSYVVDWAACSDAACESWARLFFLDDEGRQHYPAGWIVNGAPGAEALYGERMPGMGYLMGTAYQAVRREFWDYPQRAVRDAVGSVLLTMGGDDTRSLMPQLAIALMHAQPRFTLTTVTTSQSRTLAALGLIIRPPHQLAVDVDARTLRGIVEMSDVAVCAAGQTVCEMARTGLASVVVCGADNQSFIADAWYASHFIDRALHWAAADLAAKVAAAVESLRGAATRRSRAEVGQRLIDGQGARRIARAIVGGQ
jgi:UDP-2,4-diacetamido-2,4,6-trideoxy-beta-L-altropyranose hydrolase